jgi:hypothetical protein
MIENGGADPNCAGLARIPSLRFVGGPRSGPSAATGC